MPELKRRARSAGGRALVTGSDLVVAAEMPLLIAIATCLPQHLWASACLGIERVKARLGLVDEAPLLAGLRLAGLGNEHDAALVRAAQLEHHVQVLRERLAGWDAGIETEGLEHLEQARARGKGAVLWVAHFAFSALAAKMATARAGFEVFHLSRPEHGFSKSRFGIRVLNPIRTGAEAKYLSGRIVFDRDAPSASMIQARRLLRDNRVVSITAGAWEGQLLASVECDGMTFDLATGAPRLATLADAALLPVIAVRGDGERAIRVIVQPPIPVDRGQGREDLVIGVAQSFADRIAPYIRAYPHQWREWAKVRPVSRT